MNAFPCFVIGYGTGWLVVEKPAGMSVHNEPGRDLCTLLSAALRLEESYSRMLAYDEAYGVHPVHRLDKETSGVILLACRRDAFQHFAQQFSQGRVRKLYLALVHGTVCPSRERGLWQWPLTPAAAGRSNIQGQGKRSPSSTRYRVVQSSPHYTLLDCRPLTGRTHQIRRHAALAGNPVVGDRRYGSRRACSYVWRHHGFARLALHASALSVMPPAADDLQTFESAGLPLEIGNLINGDGLVDKEGKR